MYSLVVLLDPETKLNNPPLPPIYEHVDMVIFPQSLTNNQIPIIVASDLLLNNDEHGVKLNNPP